MGKKSLSSSSQSWWWRGWRYLHPQHNLRSPQLLTLFIISFVALTWLLSGLESLSVEHQLENVKKNIRSWSIVEEEDDPLNVERRRAVKEAMIHAWTCYEMYAWGRDELQPQTRDGVDSFGGLGATLVDSLDTLYIMGLDEQFQRAREWVAKSLNFNKNYEASVFETTIRVIGGLLSAYDLSDDKVFLEKARDIADRLLPAWNTPSGIPYNIINLRYGDARNPRWTGGKSILADAGSEQLEFIALSQRTNDPKYQQKVEYVIEELHKTFPADGLLPIYIDPHTGITSYSKISFGAMGDSLHGHVITFTRQHLQNWLERTITSLLDRT
ncbi:hypothetical protein PRUPE_1G073800 [Prunus persica]|uniref:alpha-1,2-Mannosidase n=1 Tax=Prunus persica TaxID=3760 RepID=A0A251QWT2_PRUPE|nr:hypothetical protein PRUPE_1G073800 [Prunus persica]